MVYCTKCGTNNEEDAEVCSKCGVPLSVSRTERRYYPKKRLENECFGLPHGGIIAGIFFGIIIILLGLSQVPGLLPENFEFWWLIPITFGVLIIAGSLYKLSRK